MVPIQISLTSSSTMSHVPLAALGYALRRAGVLAPLDEVVLPMKTVSHSPSDKVLEALVFWRVVGPPPKPTCSCALITSWPKPGVKISLPTSPRCRRRWMRLMRAG